MNTFIIQIEWLGLDRKEKHFFAFSASLFSG